MTQDPNTISELAEFLRERRAELRRDAEVRADMVAGRGEQTEFIAMYAKNECQLLGVTLTKLLKILEASK